MSRNRYCRIENCKHFTGTRDQNVHMFRLDLVHCHHYLFSLFSLLMMCTYYRIPAEPRENELWLNSMNEKSAKRISSCSGWICNLHFKSTDIEREKGKFKLKKGVIPTIFDCTREKINDERENRQNNECTEHHICETCTQKLNQMRSEHECAQLKLRLNHEIVQYKKDDQISKLKKEVHDKCEKFDGLKERVAYVEKMNRQYEGEIQSLREKILHLNGASSVKVIFSIQYSLNFIFQG